MEKETRNTIQSATQKARRLLEEDFADQLEGLYDIHVDGTIAARGGRHLTGRQHQLREKIVAAIEHKRAAGMKPDQAVLDYLRDAAFTTLNRFVALKMLEAREIVQECITRGDASSGFNEFCGLAPGVRFPDGSGYRLYLECIFDELSTEVKVLFDRRDPSSVLWPKRATFDHLLGLLNTPELSGVWGEDETIGWVYQFFNSTEERRKMREESQAPRNSRELAVRNQFFTPRYVVQFLSDNALGRVWYEMRRGDTRLNAQCEYMVRRPQEIFLGDPRQAYERIFGKRDDGDYPPSDAVQAAYNGDLTQITEDPGPDSRWISVAIPPDEISRLAGEPYRPFEDGRISTLIEDLLADKPNRDAQELPLVWAAISAFTLCNDGGAYSIKPWKKLWSKFVELARSEHAQQDNTVRQPIFVPHRAPKDPRDIRILDPACGSGHFLLYCFDILLIMYEEAWADAASPASELTGKTLREDYREIAKLKAELPRLILAHNLHGVDIDPRCAQIGQLALWMRAQRAFRESGIGRAERPIIKRANIVIAEPMPGEKDLLKEFLAELKEDKLEGLIRRVLDVPADKRARATKAMADSLAELVETVWDGMKLAGEMGTLLKIERELARAIEKGRAEWEDTLPLFRVSEYGLGGITNEKLVRVVPGEQEDFWTKAEKLVFQALADYAAAASGSGNARRRLFVEDAAQGFALADLVAKKFDVVLMNPPFGEVIPTTRIQLKGGYGQSGNDLFSAFVARGLELRSSSGVVGAITSRTGFYVSSLDQWRSQLYDEGLYVLADLGERVMDAATVEAAAYCIGKRTAPLVYRLLPALNKKEELIEAIRVTANGGSPETLHQPSISAIREIPNHPFAYWVPEAIVRKMIAWPRFEPPSGERVGQVRKGLRTGDNFRFVRAYWEVASHGLQTDGQSAETANGWVPLVMTGASQPWFAPIFLVLNWKMAGRELRTFVLKHGSESRLIQAREFYFRPGFSWTLRAARLYPYGVPAGCIFTGSRPMAFPSEGLGARSALGLFAARTSSAFIRWYAEMFARPKFAEGHLKNVPIPKLDIPTKVTLEASVDEGVSRAADAYRSYEPFLEFICPRLTLQPNSPAGLGFEPSALLPKSVETMLTKAYGLSDEEAQRFGFDLDEALSFAGWNTDQPETHELDEDNDTDDAIVLEDGPAERASRLVSYAIGVLFGRWDIRFALGTHPLPTARQIDACLPTTPRGALVGPDGEFPARIVPKNYPVRTLISGILVHDAGAEDDIAAGVMNVLDILGVSSEAVLHELNGAREWHAPGFWRSFFISHLKSYSLGRRKAPIYWQLATPSANYSVWLHIHAFTKDTLFRVQNDYVVPKLAHEERQLETLRAEAGPDPITAQRKAIEAQEDFVEELRALLDEVKRVAPLWNPSLDDGVIINFAPLWRLVPHHKPWQKELKSTWGALCAGKYDWAHLAMHLWPERVVPKCAEDRSLAIAHDLKDVFWYQDDDEKWKPREEPTKPIDAVVKERTSAAAKAALKSLMEAPEQASSARRGRGRR